MGMLVAACVRREPIFQLYIPIKAVERPLLSIRDVFLILLNINENLSASEIVKVQDITYMKTLRLRLKFIQAWPGRLLGEKQGKYYFLGKMFILSIFSITVPSGFLYLKRNFNVVPFTILGHTYVTASIILVLTFRLLLIFWKEYENLVAEFVNYIHLFNYKEHSDYAMTIHLRLHKIFNYFTKYVNILLFISSFLFNFTPLYNNVTSGAFNNYKYGNTSFEVSMYYDLPFDYIHNIYWYFLMFFFNCYLSIAGGSCYCYFDLLILLIVGHIWGHMRILINDMETFRRPSIKEVDTNVQNYLFSEEELRYVSNDLRKIIVHHNKITQFSARFLKVFGPTLLLCYLFHFVSGCVLLFECSQMDKKDAAVYLSLTFVLFQQNIQISLAFELLTTVSSNFITAVYNLPWECMDVGNRKKVHIILMKSQRLLPVKAMNMVNVGVRTMVSILKTSVTYFIMLKSFATK